MSSHNSIPVPMGSNSARSSGSSGPRRRRRKQWRPKGRPSDVRRRALRAERRLEATIRETIREIAADPKLRQKFIDAVEVDLRVDAQVARDHARVRGPTEAKPDVSRRVRRTARMINGQAAEDLVDRCRTPGERRAAAILGAELWRKQVTKVVLSIADKVEGMANMAGAELAEIGLKIEALTQRVRKLELSELAAEAQRERDAKLKRRRVRNRTARKAKS